MSELKIPKCPHCKREMVWTEYLLAHRPDTLRGRDERVPTAWAYHCRCGKWVYDRRREWRGGRHRRKTKGGDG